MLLIKVGPEWKSEIWKERAGSGVRYWHNAVSQNLSSEGNLPPNENPQSGTSGLVATFVSWIVRFLKKMWPEGNLLPNENPQLGTSGLVATFVSWIVRFLNKNVTRRKFAPEGKFETWNERAGKNFRFWNFADSQTIVFRKEICCLKKIRKLEITGWERSSFLEPFVLLKNCYRKAWFPHAKTASGNERAGSDVSFLMFAVFQKLPSELNVVQNENPHVGTSGLVATFVSGISLFLKKTCAPNGIWPRMKIRKLEMPGWERCSFLGPRCFSSKNVIRLKCCP